MASGSMCELWKTLLSVFDYEVRTDHDTGPSPFVPNRGYAGILHNEWPRRGRIRARVFIVNGAARNDGSSCRKRGMRRFRRRTRSYLPRRWRQVCGSRSRGGARTGPDVVARMMRVAQQISIPAFEPAPDSGNPQRRTVKITLEDCKRKIRVQYQLRMVTATRLRTEKEDRN